MTRLLPFLFALLVADLAVAEGTNLPSRATSSTNETITGVTATIRRRIEEIGEVSS